MCAFVCVGARWSGRVAWHRVVHRYYYVRETRGESIRHTLVGTFAGRGPNLRIVLFGSWVGLCTGWSVTCELAGPPNRVLFRSRLYISFQTAEALLSHPWPPAAACYGRAAQWLPLELSYLSRGEASTAVWPIASLRAPASSPATTFCVGHFTANRLSSRFWRRFPPSCVPSQRRLGACGRRLLWRNLTACRSGKSDRPSASRVPLHLYDAETRLQLALCAHSPV